MTAPHRRSRGDADRDARGRGQVLSPAGNLAADRIQQAANVRRQLRLVVLCVPLVVGGLLSQYQRSRELPLYEAKGLMRIVRNQYIDGGGSRKREINADVDLLDSDHFLEGVLQALSSSGHDLRGLLAVKARRGKKQSRDPRIKKLQSALKVTRVPDTELVQIAYECPDPALSALVVNTLMDRGTLLDPEIQLKRADSIEAYLAGRLSTMQQDISVQERASDREASGFAPGKPVDNAILQDLPDVFEQEDASIWKNRGSEALAAEAKRLSKTADDLREASPSAPLMRESALATLHRQQAEAQVGVAKNAHDAGAGSGTDPLQVDVDHLEAELALLRTVLGPEHPRIKALSAQIAQLKKDLKEHADAQAKAPGIEVTFERANEQSLSKAAAGQVAEARRLWEQQFRASTKQIELELQAELYTAIRERLAEERVNAGFGNFALTVAAPAQVPTAPIPRAFFLLEDMQYGLPLGVVLLGLLIFSERKLWTLAELRGKKLEVLSILPELTGLPADVPGASLHPEQCVDATLPAGISDELLYLAEALDVVGSSPQKCIVVTSSTASQGKTFVAAHLAAVLAQRGARVLLVDANLRAARGPSDVGKSGTGLSNVLSGSASFIAAVRASAAVAGLDILSAGPASSRPYDLLASQTMRELLRAAKERYAYIVLDTGALMGSPESFVLGSFSDLVLLVVRKGKSNLKDVRVSGERLRRSGSAVVGVVLSRAY